MGDQRSLCLNFRHVCIISLLFVTLQPHNSLQVPFYYHPISVLFINAYFSGSNHVKLLCCVRLN